jgi:hypothetical protein
MLCYIIHMLTLHTVVFLKGESSESGTAHSCSRLGPFINSSQVAITVAFYPLSGLGSAQLMSCVCDFNENQTASTLF